MRIDEYGDILTPKEAKDILRIGNNKIYSLLKSGTIQYFRIGNSIRIPKKSIIEFIEKSIENKIVDT